MKSRLKWFLTLLIGFSLQFAYSQERTIKGTVSEGVLPLPGANVVVKETKKTAVTDFDGNYSIQAATGQTLVFSFTGLATQEIKVGNASTINVTMKESAEILENVVIDYGFVNTSKNKVNSATAVISGKELEKFSSVVSIDNALQGKVAGVQVVAASGRPGQPARVVIRGVNGPDGSSNPLYVVDGIYMSATEMTAINPADIETQVVLKDAASAALYGSRGGNGVIVITTKKGREGRTSFSINSSYGRSERVDDNFSVMNARQYLALGEKYRAAGITSIPARTPQEQAILIANGTSWENEIFREGTIRSTQFQVTSADADTNFLASFVTDSNDGLVRPWNGQERLTGRIKVDQKLKHGMFVGANVAMSYQSDDRPRESFNVLSPVFTAYGSVPIIPVFQTNDDGSLVRDANGNPIYNSAGLPNNFSYFDIYDNYFITTRQFRIFGGVNAGVNDLFIKGLNFKSEWSANYNRAVSETFVVPGSNIASAFGVATGSKDDAGSDDLEFTWINTLSYSKTFAEKHEIAVTLFTELNQANTYSYSLGSTGYPNSFLQVQSLGGTPVEASTDRSDFLFTGGGINFNYSYDNRYSVTLATRRDGSSFFGVDRRYGNFPAVSLGWNIINEKFMQGSKIFDNLKLRVSYGESGVITGIGQTYPTTNVIFPTYNNLNGAAPSLNYSSPTLGWASRISRNVGVEMSFLKRRLNIVADYFYDTRSDFYFADNLPVEGGSYGRTINAGKFLNRGFEVTMDATILKAKDFSWNIYGNITTIDNEIQDINGLDFLPDTNGDTRNVVGNTLNNYFLVRYAGVNPANGEPLYLTADGEVTNRYDANDAVILDGKSPIPTYYGGFGTSINYKNFDVSADFAYQGGNYIYNVAELVLTDPSNYANQNMRVEAANFWTTPGQTNVLPNPINTNGTIRPIEGTDQFLQKGDFIRFRTLNIGYTFGKETFGKFPIDKFRVYFQGQNLHTWTNFKGDPEVGFMGLESTATLPGSAYRWAYPNAKIMSFGIQLNF